MPERLTVTRLVALLGFVLAVLAASCSQKLQTREDVNPAPSASATKLIAMTDAFRWAAADPQARSYSAVAPTGSMVPVIDSRSVVLLEHVTPAELQVNDIAVYKRADGLLICHRVKEVRADGILFDGDNNQGSDGWVLPNEVKWRVAGVLYTKR